MGDQTLKDGPMAEFHHFVLIADCFAIFFVPCEYREKHSFFFQKGDKKEMTFAFASWFLRINCIDQFAAVCSWFPIDLYHGNPIPKLASNIVPQIKENRVY